MITSIPSHWRQLVLKGVCGGSVSGGGQFFHDQFMTTVEIFLLFKKMFYYFILKLVMEVARHD